MQQPLVSICIPTYQRAERIQLTLQSILSQTMTDYEIVVVDNASTDGTEEAVRAFADSRIRFFRNERNIGAAMNHNRCLLEAKGTYIKFIHSDDRFASDEALEKLLETARLHPDVGLITSGYAYTDPGYSPGGCPLDVKRPQGYASLREGMRVHNIGLPSEWFFHRELLAHTGHLIDSHTCDCDFVMKALYYLPSYSIAEPLMEHAFDGSNETAAANKLNGWEAMRLRELVRLPFHAELSAAQKAGISNYLHASVMVRVLSNLWAENYHLCVQGVLDLLKLDPHLALFEGEDRAGLYAQLLDLFTERGRPADIYNFVFHHKKSRPISDIFRYGFGFRYELYRLADKLRVTGKRLVCVGKTPYAQHLQDAMPDLGNLLPPVLDDLVLQDTLFMMDGAAVDKDECFIVLTGNWNSVHLNRYRLMKNGWVEGEHYLPVFENV